LGPKDLFPEIDEYEDKNNDGKYKMTTSPLNSKVDLLKRYLSIYGGQPIELPAEIPPQLKAWSELFIEGKLSEGELEQFEQEFASNPWLLTYLERWPLSTEEELVHQRELFLQRGETLRQACLATLPQVQEAFDFSVLFDAKQEKMDIFLHRGGDVVDRLELAHGDHERTAISHSRSTKHFNLTITISHTGDGVFDMSISVQPLDLSIDIAHCLVRLSTLGSDKTVASEKVNEPERIVDFVDLAKGAYKIEFLYHDKLIEYFTMNLSERS
jgi:hypothetical protein